MTAVLLFLSKVLLELFGLAALFLVLLGLPGLWVIAVLGLALPWLGGDWFDVGLLFAAAALAEAIEFGASLGIARKSGAGKSGLAGAFLGGFAGAIVGTPILPPLGTLIGAAVGSFGAAALSEHALAKRTRSDSLKIGLGAFVGTIFGRVLKVWLGVFQVVWLAWALWFS